MKILKLISSATLTLMTILSAPVYASSVSLSSDVLHSNPSLNKKLNFGEYDFSSQHAKSGSSFKDSWKFTVAASSTASISVNDLQSKSSAARPTLLRQTQRFSPPSIKVTNVFDTKNMAFSLFDDKGKLLGNAGENDTLSNLSLMAGKWYTVRVSGKANGAWGSAYRGVLNINTALVPTVAIAPPPVMPVPLGDTAPMLGSALALLALRLRRRTSVAA